MTVNYTTANLFPVFTRTSFMVRAFQIAAVTDSSLTRPETKHLSSVFDLLSSILRLPSSVFPLRSGLWCLVSLALLGFCLIGCTAPEEEPIWKNIKIGDLAPRQDGKPPSSQLIETINFDLHIFEIPAENIDKLDETRKNLYTRPLRFNSLYAFGANSFSVHFGQIRMLDEIYNLLLAANGKILTKVSLMLADGQPESIAITGLDGPRTIFFTSTYGSREGANIGPGILALRLTAHSIPGSRGVCNVTAYPVFSPPIRRSAIPLLDARTKMREFPFSAAAFALKMGPGDFVLLGPKEYISDQTALGGLFFSNPKGSLFISKTERKPPELKPAVRIFLLVCTRTNY